MRIGVLGAGPAAGAAALDLARGGAEVTVFVPARPGEKPCGGALPGYALEELELDRDCPLPSVDSPLARLENAAGGVVQLALDGLRIFRRRDLDPWLLRCAGQAGARIVRSRARGLESGELSVAVRHDAGVEVFDWLVAADGARGLGRRASGLAPGPASLGVGASLAGVEAAALTLGFPDLADAYEWIFPRPGGCSVGIAYTPGRLSAGAARAELGRFALRHLGAPVESFTGPRYRYPIPVYSPQTAVGVQAALAGRVLLAGDAAGVADPLTREGIRYALRSGGLAARTLLAERPRDYPDRLDASLRGEMERATRATELFFDDPIGQWMVPVCRHHPGVRRVLGDLLACRQPYTGLRRRLVDASLGRGVRWAGRPGRQAPYR